MLNIAICICFWFILIQYKTKKVYFFFSCSSLCSSYFFDSSFSFFCSSFSSSSSSCMSASLLQPRFFNFLYEVLLSYCCQSFIQIKTYFTKFEVPMTVNIKITVLWYVMSYSLVDEQQDFEGSCCLHHQSRRVSYSSMYLTNTVVSHPRRPLSEDLRPWESQIYNSKITVFSASNWSSYIVF